MGTANPGDESISVDASGVFKRPQEVLAHEITHAVIFRILGPTAPTLPLWFNEGLAQYESEDSDEDDNLSRRIGGQRQPHPALGACRGRFPIIRRRSLTRSLHPPCAIW